MSFFRNVVFFRFNPSLDLSSLESGLAECQLKPVGQLELSSHGSVSPFGSGGEALTHTIGEGTWLTVGSETRLLPGKVVNSELAKKLAEIEKAEGRKPGGRTRKRIKDELIFEMLPKAFVAPGRVDASIDRQHGFIAVDTSARGKAESVASHVRQALGSFPALPLTAEIAPRSVMTGWVAGEPLPEGLTIGGECELRDPSADGGLVKVNNMELDSEEIAKHLETGKQVTRLALILDDHLSFVLGEDLVVRKLKFLDGAVNALEGTDREDISAELDARYVILVAELSRLFAVLESAFKLSKAE